MPPFEPRAGIRVPWEGRVSLALVLAAAAAFLPSIAGWVIAWRYSRIPRVAAVTLLRVHETAPGAPPLRRAEAVAAAPDGTLAVADWELRHVLLVRPGGAGRWIPPEGRFRPQFDHVGRLHLLDVDTGVLFRFTAAGQPERRVGVAPAGTESLICVDPEGRVLVAAAGRLVRLRADLSGVDPAWAPPRHAVPVPPVAGLAAGGARVFVATSAGRLIVLSSSGALVRDEPLVGNAGALAAAPGGGIALADRPTGRVFLFDGEGRTKGRLVSASGLAPVSSPADLAYGADGSLAVAAGRSLEVLSIGGAP